MEARIADPDKKQSKEQIARLCDVSRRSIATMRQVKTCDDEPGERRDEFRRKLGLDDKRTLLDVSWSSARMAWQGIERKTITEEEEAKALAQRIGQKLEGLLSRNPAVTARALEIYDANLPKNLIRAWRAERPYMAPDGEEWPDDLDDPLVDDLKSGAGTAEIFRGTMTSLRRRALRRAQRSARNAGGSDEAQGPGEPPGTRERLQRVCKCTRGRVAGCAVGLSDCTVRPRTNARGTAFQINGISLEWDRGTRKDG